MSEGNSRHEKGILDTSVIVALSRLDDQDVLPRAPRITSVTLAELAVGPLVARDDGERARRQTRLQQAESDFHPLPFDSEAARAFAPIATQLRRNGRKRAARGYDALIAAIAISRGLPLYTCNPRDFEGIDRLEVVPVTVPV